MKTNHYAQAIELTARLAKAEDENDEATADATRDVMDHVWLLLDNEERSMIRSFSEALYRLT